MMSFQLQTLLGHRAFAPLALLMFIAFALPSSTHAQQADCTTGIALQHSFNSGASWSLCADVSDVHGLQVSNTFFRAPGDLNRSILAEAHLSQILLHYHDSSIEEPQILPAPAPESNPDSDSSTSLTDSVSTSETVTLTDLNCAGRVLGTGQEPNSICERVKSNGILAKFDQYRSIQTEAWELSSTFTRETLTWNISWTFTEDGQIRPRLSLSGRSSRRNNNEQYAQQTRIDIPSMTRATILSTWRLVPALDTQSADTVEQFDFPLDIASGNRRPMQITPLSQESFQTMNRENFRGWRIIDASGAGYYLDPANNGFGYTSPTHNWANYAIAVTREEGCERYAFGNPASPTDAVCGASLDDFVNDEPLADAGVVLWFNQTRHMDTGVEDWPVIRDVQLGFDLLPFDWTATSPFELVE
jgi:Cu2+-containing amine oxidase